MKMLKKYLHKFWGGLQSIFFYKNFLVVWLNYLGFSDNYLTVNLRNGIRYRIRSNKIAAGDSYIVNEIWLYGVHNGIGKIIRNASVGFDIGAHIGVFSICAASQNPRLKMRSFEPAPDNFDLLRENIAFNRLEDRIIPYSIAVVGKKSSNREFYSPGKERALCTIDKKFLNAAKNMKEYNLKNVSVKSINVTAKTLEEIFRSEGIKFCDFIKMDCEGSEYEILFHTPSEILKRIGAFSIEYHPGHNVNDLKEFLENNGFRVSFPHRRLFVLSALSKKASS